MTQVDTKREDVEAMIYDTIAELGPERDEISNDATFSDLDIDSLDMVEIGQAIEDRWGVELSGDDVKSIGTVGEAVELVLARLR